MEINYTVVLKRTHEESINNGWFDTTPICGPETYTI